jgi:predicted glycoside hydrolase/deacetylase ChbG (UPF0249 family)
VIDRTGRACEILDIPYDTRMLIINVDDFGLCHSTVESGILAIKEGVASSCTLMVPCAWSLYAMKILEDNKDVEVGIHLTAISEQSYYRWGPISHRSIVSSLRDESGFFYGEDHINEFLKQVNLDELEQEFRVQIETVLDRGLDPTHIDGHAHIHTRREDIFNLAMSLAKEYGLALRVTGGPLIKKIQRTGLPTADYDVVDSCHIPAAEKPAIFYKMLRDLPAGLSEWAVHPAEATAEMRAIIRSWATRQGDFDFCLSEEARKIVDSEGIKIIGYRKLQSFWRQ